MQVADNMAVSIHYTLTNDDGEVIDSSVGDDALVYLHGQGNIISGLEQALYGKEVGDKFNVRIPAEMRKFEPMLRSAGLLGEDAA